MKVHLNIAFLLAIIFGVLKLSSPLGFHVRSQRGSTKLHLMKLFSTSPDAKDSDLTEASYTIANVTTLSSVQNITSIELESQVSNTSISTVSSQNGTNVDIKDQPKPLFSGQFILTLATAAIFGYLGGSLLDFALKAWQANKWGLL